jgi:hypothetical protein
MSGHSIADLISQCKNLLEKWLLEWGLPVIVLLVAIISFGLGRISAAEAQTRPITIGAATTTREQPLYSGGDIVASRSGSAYYYPWCSGATRIAERNKVSFKTEESARNAGYAPAKNCKGLVESE